MTAPGSSADPVDPACHSCGHAATDRLTGLLDRWGWDERAPAELAQAAAARDSLALLVIDIDRFKQFNDRFGHIAGDAVIKAVADTVRRSTRESDVLGRYGGHGGDEFLVLLRQTDAAEALSVAHRIRTGVREIAVDAPSTDGGIIRLDRVTTSIGVCAKVPRPEDDLTSYVVAADAALQVAKQAGRDRIRLADESRTPLPVPLGRHRAAARPAIRRFVPVLIGLGSALAAFAYIVVFAPPGEREEPAMAAAQLAPIATAAPSTETTIIVVTTVIAPPPAPPQRPDAKPATAKKKLTGKPAPTTTTEQKPLVDVCQIMRQVVGRIC
ncbi:MULTISPECIES: GGDEF domain-containing protein [unclassified Crossiella]|uniref:GGDEF domain-containing protein n=1 Tax=unclassified Crossiella TaxID=2620835 RepID=UPI001FFEC5B1|nr:MULTISPECIES: GGDEF domain-containing protein [unclassified Crossiella]MCK2244709.1 GGDEF domain-containing protein [Crossiella sp. S99.2]MCK2258304.1 GGDEF domain-containing protein [Crossiella sp. S99.1]